MDAFIIFCATYLVGAIVLGSAVVLALRPARRRHLLWLLAVALPVGYALARVLGWLFPHAQPFYIEGFEPLLPHSVDNAFPSDHMLVGGVLASVAWVADARAGVVLWALALLVGVARVAAGLHYWYDIVVAAVLAAAVVGVIHRMLCKMHIY